MRSKTVNRFFLSCILTVSGVCSAAAADMACGPVVSPCVSGAAPGDQSASDVALWELRQRLKELKIQKKQMDQEIAAKRKKVSLLQEKLDYYRQLKEEQFRLQQKEIPAVRPAEDAAIMSPAQPAPFAAEPQPPRSCIPDAAQQEQHLRRIIQDKEALDKQRAEAMDRAISLQSDLEELSRQRSRIDADLDNRLRRLKEIDRQMADLQRQKQPLEQQMVCLKISAAELDSLINKTREHLRRLTADVHAMDKRNAALESQLCALKKTVQRQHDLLADQCRGSEAAESAVREPVRTVQNVKATQVAQKKEQERKAREEALKKEKESLAREIAEEKAAELKAEQEARTKSREAQAKLEAAKKAKEQARAKQAAQKQEREKLEEARRREAQMLKSLEQLALRNDLRLQARLEMLIQKSEGLFERGRDLERAMIEDRRRVEALLENSRKTYIPEGQSK